MASRKKVDFTKANSGLFAGEAKSISSDDIGILNEESKKVSSVETVSMIHHTKLVPNAKNNKVYDVNKLDSLARDIAKRGIQEPLIVRQRPDGLYLITAGHRRFKASLLAMEQYGFKEERLPCIVRNNVKDEIDEREALILDNIQRDKTDFNRMMEIVEIRACGEERRNRGENIPNIRDYIMDTLDVGTAEISRFERIFHSLVPELMKDFREERISVNVAYEVAKLDAAVQKHVNDGWDREKTPQLTYPIMTKLVEGYGKDKDADKEDASAPEIPKAASIKYKTVNEGMTDLKSRIAEIDSTFVASGVELDKKSQKMLIRKANKLAKELEEFKLLMHAMGLEPPKTKEA